MKQNIQVIRTHTKRGLLRAHHIQVLVGYWSIRPPTIPKPNVRTKAWSRWQLLYTVGGKGMLAWPNGRLTMLPGMAILLSPHTEHTFQTDENLKEWDQYSAVFLARPHWYEWLQWPEIAPGIMQIDVKKRSDDARLRQAFDNAIAIAETPRPFWEDFTLAAMEKVLLQFHTLSLELPTRHPIVDSHLRAAVEFIEKNQTKPITLPQIARAADVSPSHLGRLFQKHLHATPKQYIDTLRINKAQRLLRETDERISQIGYLVGYDRPAHFCYRFRQIAGQTPGEYRKALK